MAELDAKALEMVAVLADHAINGASELQRAAAVINLFLSVGLSAAQIDEVATHLRELRAGRARLLEQRDNCQGRHEADACFCDGGCAGLPARERECSF